MLKDCPATFHSGGSFQSGPARDHSPLKSLPKPRGDQRSTCLAHFVAGGGIDAMLCQQLAGCAATKHAFSRAAMDQL
jgi:hypothetical protein